jgi:hypothetical protein
VFVREEVDEGGREIRGSFLGDMVTGVDPVAAYVGGPSAPDGQGVAVEVLQVVAQ